MKILTPALWRQPSLTLGLCAIVCGCANTPVFRRGDVLLPVLVAADAAPEERAAANELARVLEKMSGLPWPVRTAGSNVVRGFHVGAGGAMPLNVATDLLAPKPGEIGPDGFRIQSRDGSIFIEGATPEATGFAVAWLLQRHGGARWYAPGPGGEIVPQRTAWSLPRLRVVREPAYVSRELYGSRTGRGTDWARRNGLRERLEFTHALTTVFPPEILAAHPQWAPLLQGERYQPASAGDYRGQPNLALPEVAKHAADRAAAAFAHDPALASFSLGTNDTVRFDQSDATRALVEPLRYFRGMPDYSPLVFTFMNRAAESLARNHPNRYLGCLAYFWTENAPAFPVHPQVVPYVTTDRSQYYDRHYRAADLALMSRWGASGVKAFGLWEYGYGQNFLVPRVPHRALAEGIREGWHHGARGYFAEILAQGGFDPFKSWLLAQLLWEPDRPFEALAKDFFRGYYGAAAQPMRRFFERCEQQWMAQPGPPAWLKLYQHEDQALLFPPDVCRELRAMLAAASSAAAGDPTLSARVALTSTAFAVTEAFVEFDAHRRELASWNHDANPSALADAIGQLGKAQAHLAAAHAEATAGEWPAMTPTSLSPFVRNDPVPRLLCLVGEGEPLAPRRILAMAGPSGASKPEWRELADLLSGGPVGSAPNLAANSFFEESSTQGLEPRFLHSLSGLLPAEWEVRAMPTETAKVEIIATDAPGARRALRIESAWDTQVFQWLPAKPGRVYLATARLRGHSGAGNDAALFLTFLTGSGQVAGAHHMQSLPKGLTSRWWSAALADRAPPDAAWVGVGFGASRQLPGDWLEAAAVELRAATVETAP